MTLLKSFLDKGDSKAIDNFYTSPDLEDILISHTTDLYGTVKMTRKDDMSSAKKIEKAELVAFRVGEVINCLALERGDILLSTIHNEDMVDIQADKKEIKPQAVIDYHDTMGRIDLVAQHL
jgi:hypothetical protein